MRDYCPKCDEDISNFLISLELTDKNFIEYEKFKCPECGIKLKVKLETSFHIEEDDTVSEKK
jgi:hypothetical protein